MFKGRHEHALDAKGRVALPAPFRRDLQEQENELLVVTPSIQARCLVAYPWSEWEVFEQRVSQLSQFDESVQELRRRVVGNAQECPVDKVGRVNIPGRQREAVGIDKDVVWLGQLRWLEIWAPAELEKVAPMSSSKPAAPETIAKLAELL